MLNKRIAKQTKAPSPDLYVKNIFKTARSVCQENYTTERKEDKRVKRRIGQIFVSYVPPTDPSPLLSPHES